MREKTRRFNLERSRQSDMHVRLDEATETEVNSVCTSITIKIAWDRVWYSGNAVR